MRYFSVVQQSKARFAQDQVYRSLVEKAVTAESITATVLASMEVAVADVRARVAGIEKILKQVK